MTRIISGYLVATLAHPKTFILKGAIPLEDGHYQITDDPYGLRSGDMELYSKYFIQGRILLRHSRRILKISVSVYRMRITMACISSCGW